MPTQNKKSLVTKTRRSVRKRVKLAIVPHTGNQFRPYLIRRYGLIAVLLLAVTLQFSGTIFSHQAVLGDDTKITSTELLTYTNDTRESAGVEHVQLNEKLSQAAYYKAQDMFEHQYWAHTSPSGVQPWKWLGDVDYNYAYAGENLAKNFTNSRAVMSAWIASPTHKDNIVKPEYKEVGFAVVDGTINNEPTSVVVAMYGTPASAAVQGAQFASTISEPTGLFTKLGYAVQSASPTFIGSSLMLLFVAFIAFIAHIYRHKLPRHLQRSWYRHHGAYKALGLVSIVLVLATFYSVGGQI